MKKVIKLTILIGIIIISVLSFHAIYASVSNNLNYQGKLKDSTGNPITIPTTIQFSLYSHITNGSPSDTPSQSGPLLWSETYDGSNPNCSQITPGTDGIFAQHLGDCVAFPSYLDFTKQYYLGVKIGNDAEATPRVPLTTSPYSFTSKRLHVEGGDLYITNTDVTGDILINTAGGLRITGSNALFSGAVYNTDYSANYTDRSLVDKAYVDQQLMWEILATGTGGMRIQPKDHSVRQIYVEENSNSYTQFMVRNNNDTGNGAGAIIELKGSGADYANNMYIGKYGASFWIPELRDNGAVLTDKNLVIGTASDSHEIHFVTGNSYSDLRPVVVADNEGFRYTSDLSATFVDRTLVDKEYVDGAIASGQPTFQDVVDRSIVVDGYAHADLGAGEIEDDGGMLAIKAHAGFDLDYGVDSFLTFSLNGGMGDAGHAYIYDDRSAGSRRGLEYYADYSADYTNRTLVDKEYVDDAINVAAPFRLSGNIISNSNGGSYATDDFVFGSPSLDDDGDTDHDSRLFFDKSSGAFRVGTATGNQWDVANVGSYSVAMGNNNISSGTNAVAFGSDSTASGNNSFASGVMNSASGISSLAIGELAEARGWASVAMGGQTTAYDDFAIAIGLQAEAYLEAAIAIGDNTRSHGESSVAIGDHIQAYSLGEVALGSYENGYTVGTNGTTQWNATDRAFVVANGQGHMARSNALVILKNGTITAPDFSIAEINTAGNTALTTKEYVDNAVLSGTNNIYASNGTLTGDRTVTSNGNSLEFTGTNSNSFSFVASDGATNDTEFNIGDDEIEIVTSDGVSGSSMVYNPGQFQLSTNGVGGSLGLTLGTNMMFSDTLNSRGVEYAADYSANYTARSLVDKGYVDSHVGTSIFDTDIDTGIQVERTADDDNVYFQSAGHDIMRMYGNADGTGKSLYFGDYSGEGNETKLEISDTGSSINFNGFNASFGDLEGNGNESQFSIIDADQLFSADHVSVQISQEGVGTGELRLTENNPGSNGNNYVGFIAPTSLTGNQIWTLPSIDGNNGQVLQTNGSGTLSWRALDQGIFDTDNDTGMWVEKSADEDMIRFDIGNSSGSAHLNAMVIDTNGEIGIGTSDPSEMLTLYAANAEMEFESSGHNSGTHTIYFKHGNDSGVGKTFIRSAASGASSNGNLSFGTNNTSGFEITALGQIRSNYEHYLRNNARLGSSVNSGTKYLKFSPGETKAAIFSVPAGSYGRADLRFTVGDNTTPTEKTANEYSMIIARNGNVGIGDAITPNSKLHIDSGDINTAAILTLENTGGDIQMFRTDATPENAVTGSIGDIAFDSTNGEAYIKHSGNSSNTGWLRMLRQGDLASLWDTDADTGIQVEETADDDTIRFDSLGTEMMQITSTNVDVNTDLYADRYLMNNLVNHENVISANTNGNYKVTDYNARGTGGGYTGGITLSTDSSTLMSMYRRSGNSFVAINRDIFSTNYQNTQQNSALLLRAPSGGDGLTIEPNANAGDSGLMLTTWTTGQLRRGGARVVARDDTTTNGYAANMFFQTSQNTANNFVDRMVIKYDGNVGIGNAIDPNALLDVRGDAIFNDDGADADFRIEGDTDTNLFFADAGNDRVGIGTNTPSTLLDINGNARIRSIGSGAYSAPVNQMADGTLTTATSDRRFKKNITTIDDALDKVRQLRGVTYNWKDEQNKKRMTGMIAQEVNDVMPELVFQNPTDDYYGIFYGETSGLLVEAIKELDKKQEEKNTDFKSKISKTKSKLKKLRDLENVREDNFSKINKKLDNLDESSSSFEQDISRNRSDLIQFSNELNISKELFKGNEQKIAKLEEMLNEIKVHDSLVAKIIDSAKNVVEKVVFTAEIKFKDIVTFFSDVEFLEKVIFHKRTVFEDKDMAGTAVVKEGKDSTQVDFESEFKTIPFVTATANNNYYAFKIDNINKKGFEIKVEENAKEDLIFTWHALAVKKENSKINEDEEENKDKEKKQDNKNEQQKKEDDVEEKKDFSKTEGEKQENKQEEDGEASKKQEKQKDE